jgi:hypothetical protein
MKFRSSRMAVLLVAAALGALCASCSSDEAGAKGQPGGATANPRSTTRRPNGKVVDLGDDFKYIRRQAVKDLVKLESDDALPDAGGKVMRVTADPDAVGGKCIEIPDKAGCPEPDKGGKFARAIYKVTIETPGHYTFWCRRKWDGPCGDTLAVRFDEVGKPRNLKTEALFGSDDSSKPPRWDWSTWKESGKVRRFFLAAGEHMMEIVNREDGPRFDALLLTDDPDYVPQGIEN